MKLLLDTHTFIWWDSNPSQLSPIALNACSDSENQIFLSIASLWEMQIKHQLGKLDLRLPILEILNHQRTQNNLEILKIEERHVFGIQSLPDVHKDPFDRMLVAQALIEGAMLVSVDRVFQSYPVQLLW